MSEGQAADPPLELGHVWLERRIADEVETHRTIDARLVRERLDELDLTLVGDEPAHEEPVLRGPPAADLDVRIDRRLDRDHRCPPVARAE